MDTSVEFNYIFIARRFMQAVIVLGNKANLLTCIFQSGNELMGVIGFGITKDNFPL